MKELESSGMEVEVELRTQDAVSDRRANNGPVTFWPGDSQQERRAVSRESQTCCTRRQSVGDVT